MSDSSFENLSLDELQSYFSDFHKDFYGFRPRFATPEQWTNREWLIQSINGIHDAFDAMKKTPAGRNQLKIDGWVIDESEFV